MLLLEDERCLTLKESYDENNGYNRHNDVMGSGVLFAPLHPNSPGGAKQNDGHNDPSFCKGIDSEERITESIGILHPFQGSFSDPNSSMSSCVCSCDPESGAKQIQISTKNSPFDNLIRLRQRSGCKTKCKGGENDAKLGSSTAAGATLPAFSITGILRE